MILVVLLYLSSFLIITFTNAFITPTFIGYSCPPTKNFTINSTYHSNLNLLFSSLPSHSNLVFQATTTGQDPNKVYGLFLCRGDLNSTACQDCVVSATRDATRYCPIKKEAVIWYDECHLRYSNIEPFFSSRDRGPSIWKPDAGNVTEPDNFDDLVSTLMSEAANKAAYAPERFAAVKKKGFSVNQTVYGLVQCTQDLSISDCFICLQEANAQLPLCCGGKKGGGVLTPSCNVRFELYPFVNETFISTLAPASVSEPPRAPAPTPVTRSHALAIAWPAPWQPISGPLGLSRLQSPAPSIHQDTREKERVATWIVLGAGVPGILIFMLSSWLRMQRRYKEEKDQRRALQLLRSGDEENTLREKHQVESQHFSFFPLGHILEATRHFSDENKLGEGGFGPVYKGVLADGKEIAVKRLSRRSGQGLQEFKNEVNLIAKLNHKNLVRLLGCCFEEKELLLVYEYMLNRSLNFLLFDSMKGMHLDWKRRVSIIDGIAWGLLYLHDDSRLKIIHRDLKASNILLDHEMNPKISDFGMAKIVCRNQSEVNTNRVAGTLGYMAPEYVKKGTFSVKSDVFSFGVLLLEIISGRKNTGFYLCEHSRSLLSYAWKLWCEGNALELMDPVLVQSCVPAELLKFVHIGLLCVQDNPRDRPLMSSVIVMLLGDGVIVAKPTQPSFSVGPFVAKSDQSPSNGKACSINEVTLSNMIPR